MFWKTLRVQGLVFAVTGGVTFLALYGAFRALKPPRFGELGTDGVVIINDRPVKLPVGPVLSMIALLTSTIVALGTAAGMTAEWPTLALWWYGSDAPLPAAAATQVADPIFGRPLGFYLFSLPAWQLAAGWLARIAFLVFAMALFFFMASSGSRVLRGGGRTGSQSSVIRGLALAWGLLLLAMAAQVYLGRFARLFADHTIFAGVTYTEAHVTLTGMLLVAVALVLGAVFAL